LVFDPPHRARRVTLAGLVGIGSLLLLPGRDSFQTQALSQKAIKAVQCIVLKVPAIQSAVNEGRRPLLIINGMEAGRLVRSNQPCEGSGANGLKPESISFAKPGPAQELYGRKGRDGVIQVVVQLPREKGS
jgi:hypothetical protein